MKQRYKAERVTATKDGLRIYVRVDVGLAVRWTTVKVPWAMLCDHHQAIVEGLEAIYVAQLQADADVLYLPLEKWE